MSKHPDLSCISSYILLLNYDESLELFKILIIKLNDFCRLVETARLNLAEVGDIVVGTVLPPGSQRASECRMAAFYAGFPETVPIRTVNRMLFWS
ncbi:acetyl-CoA C-acyltransferase [Ranunculus cassubicifolius]